MLSDFWCNLRLLRGSHDSSGQLLSQFSSDDDTVGSGKHLLVHQMDSARPDVFYPETLAHTPLESIYKFSRKSFSNR
jgi:hypothetical protein